MHSLTGSAFGASSAVNKMDKDSIVKSTVSRNRAIPVADVYRI